MLIKSIHAKKIRDSRSEWTIEVSVNNCKAASPSGKSTGKYETLPWCKNIDWNIKAINKLSIPFQINKFNDLLKVESLIKKQFKLKDSKMFGANALFALESAILKALANENKKQLWQAINPLAKKMPIPVGNAIGGGLHSHARNHPVFQEFLLIPKSNSIKENVRIMNEVYSNLKRTIKSNHTNDEGALETDADNLESDIKISLYKFMLIPDVRADVLSLVKSLDNIIDATEYISKEFLIQKPFFPEY